MKKYRLKLISGILAICMILGSVGAIMPVSASEEPTDASLLTDAEAAEEEELTEEEKAELEKEEEDAGEGEVETPAPEDPEGQEAPEETAPEAGTTEKEAVTEEPAASEEATEEVVEEDMEEVPVEESDPDWVEDVVPGWVSSNQKYISGNLEVAEQVRILRNELDELVNSVLTHYKMSKKDVVYEADNLLDIFAVYAAKNGMSEDFPNNIEFNEQKDRDELLSIFNKMTGVIKTDDGKLLVKRYGYKDIINKYGFDNKQKTTLSDLVKNGSLESITNLHDTSILKILDNAEFERIQELIPSDVSGARRSVILAALSLEGKVGYFWGGKSYHVGWDDRWGADCTVSADGSESTGSVRSYGMDCSGFVSWAFINGGGDQSVLSYIGNGTAGQWKNSYTISWDEAQPGDLVFLQTPNAEGINHVGMIVSNDSSGITVVHCSTGANYNGVALTDASWFGYVKRPYIY